MVEMMAKEVIKIARFYGSGEPRVAINHGMAYVCAGQPESLKEEVRTELRKRGYRI